MTSRQDMIKKLFVWVTENKNQDQQMERFNEIMGRMDGKEILLLIWQIDEQALVNEGILKVLP
jgi:hypothetical protein